MAKCHLGKIKLKTMLASGLMYEPMVPCGFARAQYILQVPCSGQAICLCYFLLAGTPNPFAPHTHLLVMSLNLLSLL